MGVDFGFLCSGNGFTVAGTNWPEMSLLDTVREWSNLIKVNNVVGPFSIDFF